MKSFFKFPGREKFKRYYCSILWYLNPDYRKSFDDVKLKFRAIDHNARKELHNSLIVNYYKGGGTDDIWKTDMEDHIKHRLFMFRHRAIPWLNILLPLEGSKVLEVGCGTGCTSVSLAEQGCELTSIDIDEASVTVAKKRCELYGLDADFLVASATQIEEINKKFDLIIFPDSMEHMTYKERIEAISQAWELLNSGGFIVILGTPNRLYFFDRHSSKLPFYLWLPDEIAIQYSKYSPRKACADNSADEMSFIRFGRGMSFHELELALNKRCSDFDIHDMQTFLNVPIFSTIAHRSEYRWRNSLKKIGSKQISDGFYYENLNIALKKSFPGAEAL